MIRSTFCVPFYINVPIYLPYPTLPYPTLPYPTPPYPALPYPTLPLVPSCLTLPYSAYYISFCIPIPCPIICNNSTFMGGKQRGVVVGYVPLNSMSLEVCLGRSRLVLARSTREKDTHRHTHNPTCTHAHTWRPCWRQTACSLVSQAALNISEGQNFMQALCLSTLK